MYPYPVFLGMTLYEIFLCAGVVLCFFLFGVFADKVKISRRVQSFALICGMVAVIFGYCSAVFFQALYNIKTLGMFVIDKNTGATFYGGLIGGVLIFIVLFFACGAYFLKNKSYRADFFKIANCAAPSIAIAHCLGRFGCLFAGCCHGSVSDAWYAIEMHGNMGFNKYVPVQLFESLFLLALFGYLTVRLWDKKQYNWSVYLIAYGVWRFFAENLRADYRGDTVVSFLTPSQLIAILLICVGIGFVFFEQRYGMYLNSKYGQKTEALSSESLISEEKEHNDEK